MNLDQQGRVGGAEKYIWQVERWNIEILYTSTYYGPSVQCLGTWVTYENGINTKAT